MPAPPLPSPRAREEATPRQGALLPSPPSTPAAKRPAVGGPVGGVGGVSSLTPLRRLDPDRSADLEAALLAIEANVARRVVAARRAVPPAPRACDDDAAALRATVGRHGAGIEARVGVSLGFVRNGAAARARRAAGR